MQPASTDSIKAFVMDIDGTLTEGFIGHGANTVQDFKFFNVKDGLGIKILQAAGIHTAIITGKSSSANEKRAKELGITLLFQGQHDKKTALLQMCGQLGISPEECLFIGDDLNDLPALRIAGIATAVADAASEVIAVSHWVMTKRGGCGAVREAAEKLLKAKGLWEDTVNKLFGA